MPIIKSLGENSPQIADDAFIAENATIIGDVTIGSESSVWYGAVLRADVGPIKIGKRSNIQDLACIHMTLGMSTTEVGDEVTVGHGAVIHGAKVRDGALVGMGAVVLDNAEIGEEAIIAAGAVVPPGMQVPPRTMVRAAPAKIAKELGPEQAQFGRLSSESYLHLAKQYR